MHSFHKRHSQRANFPRDNREQADSPAQLCSAINLLLLGLCGGSEVLQG